MDKCNKCGLLEIDTNCPFSTNDLEFFSKINTINSKLGDSEVAITVPI